MTNQTTVEVIQADIDAASEADIGAVDAARALSRRRCGASQSEMREARRAYLATTFARHRLAHTSPPPDDVVDAGTVQFATTVLAELEERAPHYGIRSIERGHLDRAILAIAGLLRSRAALSAIPRPAELVEAARPFAEAAAVYVDTPAVRVGDDVELWQPGGDRRTTLTVGHLRRLAAALSNVGQEEWRPIESAPHACHVLACRFDRDVGEWVYGVVLSPPSYPFTHFMPLPTPPSGVSSS